MDAYELITTRRSTRKFREEPVPDELLQKVLEAGRHAPSGGNNQTTHLLVIRNREILAELAAKAEQEFAKMKITPDTYKSLAGSIRASKKGGYIFHYHAPVLILTANKKSYSNNIADCACVLENMMLMANALDLGSVWINQMKWLNGSELINEVLFRIGMKEDERVYGGLALGFADTEDGLPVRTPLPRTGNPVTFVD
ncbi:MAG: nitroreductase [Lachnospiraceae bacterium]|nr:nitroreductase [Lachnospiraceae bacterium]